jgi:hypothetical protein
MTERARTETLIAMFDTSLAALQWTVTAFYIPFAAMLIAVAGSPTSSAGA